jgi:hypothetical protein
VRRSHLELFGALLVLIDRAAVGPCQLTRTGHNRLKHDLQIERRADRPAHLPQRLQLLDGSPQLAGPGLQLLEQADVLDGNHRLVGEGFDQFDLLVGERPNLHPPHRNHADQITLATHWHTEKRSDPADASRFNVPGTPLCVGLRIEDLDGPGLQRHAADNRAVSWPNRVTVRPFSKCRRGVVIHREAV